MAEVRRDNEKVPGIIQKWAKDTAISSLPAHVSKSLSSFSIAHWHNWHTFKLQCKCLKHYLSTLRAPTMIGISLNGWPLHANCSRRFPHSAVTQHSQMSSIKALQRQQSVSAIPHLIVCMMKGSCNSKLCSACMSFISIFQERSQSQPMIWWWKFCWHSQAFEVLMHKAYLE